MSGKRSQTGFTLIEVLVTFLLTAIGLLGLAALQVSTINNGFEAHQRALVTALVDDMAERVRMNPVGALENYQTFDPETPCPSLDVNAEVLSNQVRAGLDKCQWAAMLQGVSVREKATDTRGLGAPIGAMGCLDTSARAGGEIWVRVAVAVLCMSVGLASVPTCRVPVTVRSDLTWVG